MPNGFSRPNASGFRLPASGYSRAGTARQPQRWIPPEQLQRQRAVMAQEFAATPGMTRDAMVATVAPRVPWDEFVTEYFAWERGEHIGLVGPTGQGKTTLIFNLYPMHPFTAVFGTKPKDENMDAFVNSGFIRLEQWRSLDARQHPRRVIWPHPRDLREMIPLQRKVFVDAMEAIYSEGYWDLIIDEGYYIDEQLKLGGLLRLFYTQVRALGISLVLATQRPAWVPVEVYDQSTHLFFWRDNDARNLRRLQEVSLIHAEAIKEIVPNLERFQVLYLNTRTGQMCRTRCPKIDLPLGR